MASQRVDFYVVQNGRGGADRVACRVAEKAFQQGLSVVLRTGTADRARSLDDMLWTFSGASFVPHALAEEATPEVTVILDAECADHSADLLINLADGPPGAPERFARIAEVVGPGDAERRSGRERFRYYRDELGLEPETHRIGG